METYFLQKRYPSLFVLCIYHKLLAKTVAWDTLLPFRQVSGSFKGPQAHKPLIKSNHEKKTKVPTTM